ncbi:head-tail connector protein [Metabacillus halosaccharovorans]|uniref:head-tail connector protein n=1 Tax=Metabacillus halosaccharovorans TaxID=930124 RepID=UPI00403D7810
MLEQLKSYLKITWNNDDALLQSLIARGQDFLNDIAGIKLNFEEDTKANQLLMDYGRYAYNHSLELFEINFKRELLKLSIREGVKAHVAATTETSS